MITGSVTIKGKEYALGELAASDDNARILDSLMCGDGTIQARDFFRALRESIADGAGAEAAETALADLKISFKQGSDYLKAMEALCKSVFSA